MISAIRKRWHSPGGYRELLTLAIPLVLSTSAWSIQHFIDRMFLTWYSAEAIAATMPAGLLNFTIMSLFLGTAGYVNTFIAQYYGSDQLRQIGPALGQGLYIALAGGFFLLLMRPLTEPIFRFIGHGGQVYAYEVIYFRILCLGAFPAIASSAMSGFYSGRGRTWPLVWINLLATAVNLGLDYVLIFGKFGFPSLGVRGAAIATVLSACAQFLVYLVLIARRKYRQKYATDTAWKFNPTLFPRILKYGLPNGIQFFVDIFGFTAFLMIVGKLGTNSLAATNIALNINNLAFLPMIGFGIAVSVRVGQCLGSNQPELAEKSTYSGFHMTLAYMLIFAALYLFFPGMFIRIFAVNTDPEIFAPLQDIIRILLRFVALYSIFDTFNIIFAAAIKGAGDTRFVMRMILGLSIFIFIIPSYVTLILLGGSVFTGWMIASFYIGSLGIGFFLRFRGGKWKSMRVIECPAPCLPGTYLETPTPD